MFTEKLIGFIDELLTLFEDKNKIIYTRLIRLHHRIKNVIPNSDVVFIVRSWATSDMMDKIARRDVNLLKNTEFELDADWMWNELTASNKTTIWKWADVLMAELI